MRVVPAIVGEGMLLFSPLESGVFIPSSLTSPLSPSFPRSLKKAASRAGTTLMQKTGQIERTVDREFAEEEGRYRA
jgi:hypothetical protein